MKQGWEREVQEQINQEISSIDFSRETEDRILTQIHQQIEGGRKMMKWTKKQTRLILAAAMVIIGTTTAIGAGKVVFTSGGHSVNDELHDSAQLKAEAENALGKTIGLPEGFLDGTAFVSGIVSEVKGMDENRNLVDSHPQVFAEYKKGNKTIFLNIEEPFSSYADSYVDSGKGSALLNETYNDISIRGTKDNYLFLPPDSVPSEEDKQLEAEGKLFISYGSSEVERKIFTSVSWNDGSLRYHLHTFEDVELSDLAEMAKEIISSQR